MIPASFVLNDISRLTIVPNAGPRIRRVNGGIPIQFSIHREARLGIIAYRGSGISRIDVSIALKTPVCGQPWLRVVPHTRSRVGGVPIDAHIIQTTDAVVDVGAVDWNPSIGWAKP